MLIPTLCVSLIGFQQGFIDRQEFAELCANFQIPSQDADAIFEDLDRDHDGRIRQADCVTFNVYD